MNTTFTPASNKKQISQPIKILLILIILVLIVAGIYLISQTPHIKSFIQGTYQNIVFQIQSYKPTPTQQTPITLSNSKDKQKVTQQLLSSGFKQKGDKIVGSRSLDLKASQGRVIVPITLESTDGSIQVDIPEHTIFQEEDGTTYTGIIIAPKQIPIDEHTTLPFPNLQNAVLFKVGSETKSVELVDTEGEPTQAMVTLPMPGVKAGERVMVYLSEDGQIRDEALSILTREINKQAIAVFDVEHFSWIVSSSARSNGNQFNGNIVVRESGNDSPSGSCRYSTNGGGTRSAGNGNAIEGRCEMSWYGNYSFSVKFQYFDDWMPPGPDPRFDMGGATSFQYVAPITGICGSATATATSTAPTQNLCNAGTATSVTNNTTTFNRTCQGQGGGGNASCSVAQQKTTSCSAKSTNSSRQPSDGTFTQTRNGSSRTPFSYSSVYNTSNTSNSCEYYCNTNYTWNGSSCALNGVCATFGGYRNYQPATSTANGCAVNGGTYADTSDDVNYRRWQCIGLNGGSTDSCIALKDTIPPLLSFIDNVHPGPVNNDTITASWGDAIQQKRRYHTNNLCPSNESSYGNINPIETQDTETNNGKRICLFGKDSQGNVAVLASANSININTSKPITTINPNDIACTGTDISSITLTCTDPSGGGCTNTSYKIIDGSSSCNTSGLISYAPFSLSGTIGQYTSKKVCYQSINTLNNKEDIKTSNNFNIDKSAPSIPSLISPTTGASVTTYTPTFTRSASTDNSCSSIAGYSIEIHRGSTCADFLSTTSTASTSYITSPLTNGNYSWKVKSYDGLNNQSARSSCRSFTVSAVLPIISINSPSPVWEGSGITFSITLNITSPFTITFNYESITGTAFPTSDFTVMIGSTGINASATGTTLIVTTISDTSYEPTETFSLVLSNPSNATIGVGTGIGTIQDNDTVCSDGFKDTDGQDNIPSNTDDEECDDGNIINDDGCTSLCKIESGCSCTGEPSVCTCEDCPFNIPPANINDICNDNNSNTIADRINETCICQGTPVSPGFICNQFILYDDLNNIISGGISDNPNTQASDDMTCFDLEGLKCSSITSSIGRKTSYITELGDTQTQITCQVAGPPVDKITIDCGNGTKPIFTNITQASYLCIYTGTTIYTVQCLINDETEAITSCKNDLEIKIDVPFGVCGDGFPNQHEDCDVKSNINGIIGNMSLAGGQLFYNNGSYIISPIEDYADYSCINCQLYQNEVPCHMTQAGCIDFQPSCTSVDSTISFMKEDLGIFWWDLNNNTGNRTPSCSSPDDERKMINGSAQCEFIIQHAGVQYGTFSDDCFIDLRGSHNLFSSMETQLGWGVTSGAGRYYLSSSQMNDFFVSTDAPLGEYEVILNKITIDYCTPDEDYDNIPETKTSTHDLACKENFALVGPYAVQRGIFSTVQTEDIFNYETINGMGVFNTYLPTNSSQSTLYFPNYRGGSAINDIINTFASKHSKLATSEGGFGPGFVGTALARNPEKNIYVAYGDMNIKEEEIPEGNFTLIVNSGNLIINNNLQSSNAMFVVPNGKIIFNLSGICNQTINRAGIFIANQGFDVNINQDVLNDQLTDNYCQFANIRVSGILVGSDTDSITSKLRSNWNNRFSGGGKDTILYSGAALSLEINPALLINPPAGFEELRKNIGFTPQ